jgi:hypothetical protein
MMEMVADLDTGNKKRRLWILGAPELNVSE